MIKIDIDFVSLFAGIGGFDLGLERSGMRCVGQVEKDEYCQAVLAHHWPQVKRVANIYDVTESDFGAVDLICGGFPCQPFSLAGKRGGAEDDRYLWPEMLRVIKAYRPAWVLGENVAGIIGVELDKVLSQLEAIGYSVQCFIIPACAVDAPHRRDRVWIVGYANSNKSGAEFGNIKKMSGFSEEKCEPKHCAIISCGTSKAISDTMRVGFGQHVQRDSNSAQDSTNRDSCRDNADRLCETLADTPLMRMEGLGESRFGQSSGLVEEVVSDRSSERTRAAQWEPEPDVGRLADGVSNRVAQLRALGNAVVPQVVEEIGRAIMKAEECARGTRGRAGEHHATPQGQNAQSSTSPVA